MADGFAEGWAKENLCDLWEYVLDEANPVVSLTQQAKPLVSSSCFASAKATDDR